MKPCGIGVARSGDVAAADLQLLEAEALGQLVHLALDGEGRFEVAVAAHRARVGVVRVGDRGVEAHDRAPIETSHRREHHVGRGRAPRDVGAVVDHDVAVAGQHPAVGGRRRAQPDRARLPGRARDEFLEALELDLHRPPHPPGQQRGDDVDRVEVEAPPEVAADGRLQHAHAVAGRSQRLGQVSLIEERHLGRRPHRQPVLEIPVGDRHHRAQAGRGDEVQPVLTLDHGGGGGERGLDVAVAELVAQVGVIRRPPLVHQRRARPHRRHRIEHGGQLCVLDLDEVERCLRDGRALGRHRGDLVAHTADLVRLQRDLVLGEAERVLLDLDAGEHGQHAGQRRRPCRVDPHDPRVGVPGSQDLAVDQPRQRQVVQVARAAGDLVGPVALGHVLADDGQRGHLARPALTPASPPASARRAC